MKYKIFPLLTCLMISQRSSASFENLVDEDLEKFRTFQKGYQLSPFVKGYNDFWTKVSMGVGVGFTAILLPIVEKELKKHRGFKKWIEDKEKKYPLLSKGIKNTLKVAAIFMGGFLMATLTYNIRKNAIQEYCDSIREKLKEEWLGEGFLESLKKPKLLSKDSGVIEDTEKYTEEIDSVQQNIHQDIKDCMNIAINSYITVMMSPFGFIRRKQQVFEDFVEGIKTKGFLNRMQLGDVLRKKGENIENKKEFLNEQSYNIELFINKWAATFPSVISKEECKSAIIVCRDAIIEGKLFYNINSLA